MKPGAMQAVSVRVPVDLVMSANRRSHWGDDARRKQGLRLIGRNTGRHLYAIPENARVKIDVDVFKGTAARHDPSNLGDTMKSILDGMVTAGWIVDDDYRHVDGPHMHYGGVDTTLRAKRLRRDTHVRLDMRVTRIGGAL